MTFAVATPPTPADPEKAVLRPDFGTVRASGKCRYRPWCSATLDGLPFFANGYDRGWYWDGSTNFRDMGSDAATGFTAAVTGGSGWLPAGAAATYYIAGRNSTLGKETYAQTVVSNTAGGTRDVQISGAGLGGEFDSIAIYRRLQNSDGIFLVAIILPGALPYTDSLTDAQLRTTNIAYVERKRSTKPPIPELIAAHLGRLWLVEVDSSNVLFSQPVRTDSEFLLDDVPPENEMPIAPEDGFGKLTAILEHNDQFLFFKRRAVYVLDGEDVLSFTVRRLFHDRGCLNWRCAIPVEDMLFFLDERGVYAWRAGGEPVIAGADTGTRDSALAPIWDRLNLDQANLFWACHNEAEGLIHWYVALDNALYLSHRINFDYTLNRFVSIDTLCPGGAGGYLEDSLETQHLVRLDELGVLWEEEVSNSQGVYAGSLTGAFTSGTTRLLGASGASLDTSVADGILGAPYDRYNAAGEVVDENRSTLLSGTTAIRPLYRAATAYASGDTFAVGVIPALFGLPKTDLGTDARKGIPEAYLQLEPTTGTLRVDTSSDENSWVNKREIDVSAVAGWAPVLTEDYARHWRIRFSMRYPGSDFALKGVAVPFSVLESREP
jgi:hypothetical protein